MVVTKGVKISEEDDQYLAEFCKANNVNTSEAIRIHMAKGRDAMVKQSRGPENPDYTGPSPFASCPDEGRLLNYVAETLDECATFMKRNANDVNEIYLGAEAQRISWQSGYPRMQVLECMDKMSNAPRRAYVGKWIHPILIKMGVEPFVENKPTDVKAPVIVKEMDKYVRMSDDVDNTKKVAPHEELARKYVHELVYQNVWPNSSMACSELAMLLLKCYNDYNVPVEETLDAVYRQSRYAQGIEDWNKEMCTMLDNFKGYQVGTDGTERT